MAKKLTRAERRAKMARAMAKLDSAVSKMDSTIDAQYVEPPSKEVIEKGSNRDRLSRAKAKMDSIIKARGISPAGRARYEKALRKVEQTGIFQLERDPAEPDKKVEVSKATREAVTPTEERTGLEAQRAMRDRGMKAMDDANVRIDSMAKSSGKPREPFEYYSGGKRVFGKEAEEVRERSNTLRELRQEQTLFKHRVKGRHKGETKALAYYKKQREKGKLKETDPAFINLAKIDSLQNRFSELGDSSFKEVQQRPGSRSVFSWGGKK